MRHFEKYEEHVARYREWLERMPKSDNVNDFIRDRGLHIPFAKVLFAESPSSDGRDVSRTIDDCNNCNDQTDLLPAVCSTNSVRWSGRNGECTASVPYARVDRITGLPVADARQSTA